MDNDSGSDNEPSGVFRQLSEQDLPEVITPESLVARVDNIELSNLNYRITQISDNLESTLRSIVKMHAFNLQEERECKALDTELQNWETLMDELETVVGWLIDRQSPAIPSDDAQSPDKALAEEAHHQNHQNLLESFEKQEKRIRELEQQLRDLAATEDSTEQEENPYVNRIILTTNGNENFKFPLNRSIMIIGREAKNDIHIPSRFVSRYHARIVSDSQGSIIEDLDSINGVRVNSKKVRRKQLRSGDLIDIGRTQLKFIDLMEGSSSEGSA